MPLFSQKIFIWFSSTFGWAPWDQEVLSTWVCSLSQTRLQAENEIKFHKYPCNFTKKICDFLPSRNSYTDRLDSIQHTSNLRTKCNGIEACCPGFHDRTRPRWRTSWRCNIVFQLPKIIKIIKKFVKSQRILYLTPVGSGTPPNDREASVVFMLTSSDCPQAFVCVSILIMANVAFQGIH